MIRVDPVEAIKGVGGGGLTLAPPLSVDQIARLKRRSGRRCRAIYAPCWATPSGSKARAWTASTSPAATWTTKTATCFRAGCRLRRMAPATSGCSICRRSKVTAPPCSSPAMTRRSCSTRVLEPRALPRSGLPDAGHAGWVSRGRRPPGPGVQRRRTEPEGSISHADALSRDDGLRAFAGSGRSVTSSTCARQRSGWASRGAGTAGRRTCGTRARTAVRVRTARAGARPAAPCLRPDCDSGAFRSDGVMPVYGSAV